jgi:hypothetical protein
MNLLIGAANVNTSELTYGWGEGVEHPEDAFGLSRSQARTRSGEIEAVEFHYLVPRRYEVVHELLLGVLTGA